MVGGGECETEAQNKKSQKLEIELNKNSTV